MKLFIFSIVILLVNISSYAQIEIGLQVSPSISSNRITTESNQISIKNDGSTIKFKLGFLADFPLSENYYFSTGLAYTPKRVTLTGTAHSTTPFSEAYDLQYVQIPLTIKLYTNEIVLDTRLFFNIGVNAEILISEKFDKTNLVIKDFRFFDSSFVLGAGVERKTGTNTAVYVALSYNRGFLNPITTSLEIDKKLILKNDIIGLDLGIKF